MVNSDNRETRAKNEFQEIITNYILPMMDTRGNLKCISSMKTNKNLVDIVKEKDDLYYAYFYPTIGTEEEPTLFYCKIGLRSVATSMKRPATIILRELLKVSEYNYDASYSRKRDYGRNMCRQISYKSRTLDLTFELGMCQWLTNTFQDAATLHAIICRMIEWSSRTYEGKNIPFGIIISFSENAADYLHFLENDSSAVFTDGIYTGIILDKRGKVLSFITRYSPVEREVSQNIFVPYQFVDIARHCTNTSIGVIVLTNGEILIVKNQALCFAKRGRKWIYFDWTRVYSTLRPYFLINKSYSSENEMEIRKKIQAIYCTLLDVSFAHSGGCLALVVDENDEKIDRVIKERIDLCASGVSLSEVNSDNREKIEVLTYLLSYPQKGLRSFFEVEGPLRREILSLDGATVVSLDGRFYCAGSIVSVPGGSSSGGGRTAAAKELAEFGVGIKISEDGYIEAYGIPLNGEEGENLPRKIKLFSFK